jgi:hypothetical protein
VVTPRGVAAWAGAAAAGAAGDAAGIAIARGADGAAGIAAEVPGVPAGSLRAAPATVPWPDTSAITAATMTRKTAAEAATAVWKLISSSQELMVHRSLPRPAGRA